VLLIAVLDIFSVIISIYFDMIIRMRREFREKNELSINIITTTYFPILKKALRK